MSFCEFHPEYQKHLKNYSFFENELVPNLQQELQWGLSYRNLKKTEKDRQAIPIKKSPVDIPFKLCRERERKRKSEQAKKNKKKVFTKSPTTKKLSLLEKSVLSQDKYMEYLSTPNPKFEEPPLKKRKKKCIMEPCSPRLVNLAVPNKRRVYANWKDFSDRLPIEMLLRFEQILYTNNSLEPRDARYYYKKLDKEKKKKRRAKKALKTKKQNEKEKNELRWIKQQIEKTAKAIIDFIKDEPLFTLNYKQLLLSDSILNTIAKKGMMKKPQRNSKNSYRTTVIEISDKLALWMDTLIRFVDVQAVESDEDIPPMTISSIEISSEAEEGEEEEEGESGEIDDEETSSEGEEMDHDFGGGGVYRPAHETAILGEDGEYDLPDVNLVGKQILSQNMTEFGEEFGEAGLEEFLGDLNGDQLEKLIRILSNCSDEFLDSLIDPDNLPETTYKDVLDKLNELKKKMDDQSRASFLEQLMVTWAMQNNPDEVDSKLLKKIKEAAAIIEQSLKNKGTSSDKPVDVGEDPLTRLIAIFGSSSDDFLNSQVDTNEIPGVTYQAILKRLIKLKDEWNEMNPHQTFVEKILIEWAKRNDDEMVDSDLLKKIKACSTVIEEWLNNKLGATGHEKFFDASDNKLRTHMEFEKYAAVDLIDFEDKVPNSDLLEKYVQLLRQSSETFLVSNIDEEKVPGISYKDVMDRIIEIQSELDESKREKSLMEQVLHDWIPKNAPEMFDPEIQEKIREVAVVLNEWVKSEVGNPQMVKSEVKDETLIDKKSGEVSEEQIFDKEIGDDKIGDEKIDDEKIGDEQIVGEEEQAIADIEEFAIDEGEDQITEFRVGEQSRDRLGTYMDLEEVVSEFGIPEEETWGMHETALWLDEGEEVMTGAETAIPLEEKGQAKAEIKPKVSAQVAVIYEKGEATEEGEEGPLIKGHKPSVIMEHSPNTVCCLSLKIWAVWLLEITHNAHSWTKWTHELIKQVREYAAIVRGDVTLAGGKKKILLKGEWRKFVRDTEEKIVAWRQYSAHVKDLSISIVDNFQGKKIVCCPKCLQDHLIKNVVVAHQTLRALTEAMNCAAYWRRSLDNMVDITSQLANTEPKNSDSESDSSETDSDEEQLSVSSPDRTEASCVCRSRLQEVREETESDESLYELEELDIKRSPTNQRRRS